MQAPWRAATGYQGLDTATATNDQVGSAADDINDAWNDVVDKGNDGRP